MYVRRIGLALDDVQHGDVTGGFAGREGDHAVLWLEEAAHDIEDCGLADCLRGFDGCAGEGCIGGHEEVAARGRDEGGNDGAKVVMHVAWISQGGCGGGHGCRDKLVCLLEGRFLDV